MKGVLPGCRSSLLGPYTTQVLGSRCYAPRRYLANRQPSPDLWRFHATGDVLAIAEKRPRAAHSTVKPVALVADAIRDCSHRKGIVLDAFAGSGTTLIAAEQTGRRGYGIEIDPLYCDVIIRRLRTVCGLEAILESAGKSFQQIEAERCEASLLPN